MFGGVLLTTEKVEDFEWAFSKFVEIMGGKEPQTILTDFFDLLFYLFDFLFFMLFICITCLFFSAPIMM